MKLGPSFREGAEERDPDIDLQIRASRRPGMTRSLRWKIVPSTSPYPTR